MSNEQRPSEPSIQANRKSSIPARHPPVIVLLMVLASLAFLGAAVIGLFFAELLGRAGIAMVFAAGLFAISMSAGLFRAKPVIVAAAIATTAACAAGIYAAMEAQRRYDEIEKRLVGGRTGRVIIEPGTEQGRQLATAMVASITAWIATIIALPLVIYLAVRAAQGSSRESDART